MARLRVTRVHTLSPLSLSLSFSLAFFVESLMNGETPMRNVLRKSSLFFFPPPFPLPRFSSRFHLLPHPRFFSQLRFFERAANRGCNFFVAPRGTLRYYNETRIRKKYIFAAARSIPFLSSLFPRIFLQSSRYFCGFFLSPYPR